MAATVAARLLTEAHRIAQARLAAVVFTHVRGFWPLLDPTDVDATFEAWFRAVQPTVLAGNTDSARLAATYVDLFKKSELGAGARPVLGRLNPEAFRTSMLVTGPVTIKDLTPKYGMVRAAETALANSTGAALRHTLNGGRDTIVSTVGADPEALGWARVTSSKPCGFCAMLASRGPVYSQGGGGFQAHDHCHCTAEPVYRDGAPWPTNSDRWASLWDEAKSTGGDTVKNFQALVAAA